MAFKRIQALFKNTIGELTVEDITTKAQISKTTVRRYLEYCIQINFLKVEIRYGKIGRPERYYRHVLV